jgi:ATP-binding cassette, subfamily B, bacterial PglK
MSDRDAQRTLLHSMATLLRVLSRRRRAQVAGLLLLMVISAFAELVTLGAVIPFVGVLLQPELAFETRIVRWIADMIGVTQPHDMLAPITLGFAGAAVVAGTVRLVVIRINTRLAFLIGADIGVEVFWRTMAAPYEEHAKRNSSEVISGITRKVDGVVRGIILAALGIVSSGLVFLFSLGALLAIDWRATIAMFGIFGSTYLLLSVVMRQRLRRYGAVISRSEGQVFRALSEGLGGIRDVLLHDKLAHYRARYRQHDLALRNAQADSLFVSQFPRYALEALAIVLLALVSYGLVSAQSVNGAASSLPILAAMALGGQRMLPALQMVYAGWSQLVGYRSILNDVLGLLMQPVIQRNHVRQPIAFQREVRFENVTFSYHPTAAPVLDALSMTIPRGAKVGLIGETGSGKSTLVDLFMGLLVPTSGRILLDEVPLDPETMRSWQERIAHVPQTIYLTDGSFAENIAWSEPTQDIDFERLVSAAQQAQIWTMIDQTPDGFDGRIGENGVRLSGGQRQRLAIARALYRRPDVLVFDEATSALDGDTEKAVIDTLAELGGDLTVLMIAHRFNSLRCCDVIFRLDKGRVVWSGSYESLMAKG